MNKYFNSLLASVKKWENKREGKGFREERIIDWEWMSEYSGSRVNVGGVLEIEGVEID